MNEYPTKRLIEYANYKGIPVSTFEKSIGKAPSYLRNSKDITSSVMNTLMKVYPDLSMNWLITGNGDMINDTTSCNISNQINNSRIASDGGSVGVGNMINVTLPESGTQKIINPDGKIELSSASSNSRLDELIRENAFLKEKISHLVDNMSIKDDLIASLKETIELLKHKQ